MKMPDNQDYGVNHNARQYDGRQPNNYTTTTNMSPLSITSARPSAQTSAQDAQLRSAVEAQHPNLPSSPINRTHTPLHHANPTPSSLSSAAQPSMLVGGATPWHSPVSSTMSSHPQSSNEQSIRSHPRGIRSSVYANDEGNSGGIRNVLPPLTYSANTRSFAPGGLNSGGHNSDNTNISVSGSIGSGIRVSSWAPSTVRNISPPLRVTAPIFGSPPASAPGVIVSAAASVATGPPATSIHTSSSSTSSSADREGHVRLNNLKVVGLGGSMWATPQAAAREKPRPIEDIFNGQSKGVVEYNKKVNASALCQAPVAALSVTSNNQNFGQASARVAVPTAPRNYGNIGHSSSRRAIPTGLRNSQGPGTASARAVTGPPSHDKLFAMMRKANSQSSVATKFTPPQPREEIPAAIGSSTPRSSVASAHTPPPAPQQPPSSITLSGPSAAIASTSTQRQSFEKFHAASVRSVTSQLSTASIQNRRPPSKEHATFSSVAAPRAPSVMSAQGSDRFAVRVNNPQQSVRSSSTPTPPPNVQQEPLSMQMGSSQAAITSSSTQKNTCDQLRASSVGSVSPQAPYLSTQRRGPPTREQLAAAFRSAAPSAPVAMFSIDSDCFVPPVNSPPHLESSLVDSRPNRKSSISSNSSFSRSIRPARANTHPHFEPSARSTQLNSNSQSSSNRSFFRTIRPDSTAVVIRRMVGRALGVEILKKEDARSIAIDSALKDNSNGGKNRRDDVKDKLEKDELVKDDMVKVDEGFSAMKVVDQKENVKEAFKDDIEKIEEAVPSMIIDDKKDNINLGTEIQPKKDWGAFLGTWKAGQTRHTKHTVKKEDSSNIEADDQGREREAAVLKTAQAKKKMNDFYAMMKSKK